MPRNNRLLPEPLLKVTWASQKQGTKRAVAASLGNAVLVLVLIACRRWDEFEVTAKCLLRILLGH